LGAAAVLLGEEEAKEEETQGLFCKTVPLNGNKYS
jgi:hypothetical protein